MLENNDSCVIPPTLEGWVYRQWYIYMGYRQAIWATLTYIYTYTLTKTSQHASLTGSLAIRWRSVDTAKYLRLGCKKKYATIRREMLIIRKQIKADTYLSWVKCRNETLNMGVHRNGLRSKKNKLLSKSNWPASFIRFNVKYYRKCIQDNLLIWTIKNSSSVNKKARFLHSIHTLRV
jgi:hypothetical protein